MIEQGRRIVAPGGLPMVLGDIYNQQHGWFDGNLVLINGEAAAGILFGLPLMAWFVIREKNRSRNILEAN
jgi:hypothetical protein